MRTNPRDSNGYDATIAQHDVGVVQHDASGHRVFDPIAATATRRLSSEAGMTTRRLILSTALCNELVRKWNMVVLFANESNLVVAYADRLLNRLLPKQAIIPSNDPIKYTHAIPVRKFSQLL